MSVVESRREEGKLKVLTKANELAVYTIKICSNEKNFPKRVSHERRKLKRLTELSKKGVISKSKVGHCFESWKSYVDQGDCYSIIKAMDSYYNQLWKENV